MTFINHDEVVIRWHSETALSGSVRDAAASTTAIGLHQTVGRAAATSPATTVLMSLH